MDLIHIEVFAGLTVLHLTVGLTLLLLLGIGLQSLFKKKDDADSTTISARCTGCGWAGKLSRYQRKCPRCNGEVLQSGRGN